jgi:hypothetical protein
MFCHLIHTVALLGKGFYLTNEYWRSKQNIPKFCFKWYKYIGSVDIQGYEN